jgi:hypothetical protein
MKRIIRLTESDLTRIVRRVVMEQSTTKVYIEKNGEEIEIGAILGDNNFEPNDMGKSMGYKTQKGKPEGSKVKIPKF